MVELTIQYRIPICCGFIHRHPSSSSFPRDDSHIVFSLPHLLDYFFIKDLSSEQRMKVVHGDLLKMAAEGDFDVIVHGCNCFCQMGAGIARPIRQKFPQAYIEDRKTVRGDVSKLGTYTFATVETSMIVPGTRLATNVDPAPASILLTNSHDERNNGSSCRSSTTSRDEWDGSRSGRENVKNDHLRPYHAGMSLSQHRHTFVIVNAYTQYDWRGGPGIVNVDYDAVRRVFSRIGTDFNGRRIGYPKIGAGLAGGDWRIISNIIDDALDGQNHTLVEFRQ